METTYYDKSLHLIQLGHDLINQLFTPNSPLAELSGIRLKIREGPDGLGSNPRNFAKNYVNFHKMNVCYELLQFHCYNDNLTQPPTVLPQYNQTPLF